MTPRFFPQTILDTKVLNTSSTPYSAVVIIKYRKEEHNLTTCFSGPIFDLGTPAKSNAWRAACEYIIRNFMDKLKQLDDGTLMSDIGPDVDQYDDEDLNADNMINQPQIEDIPEQEPSVIKDRSSNSDKDTTRTHHLTINQVDVNLLSPLLDIPTEDRRRQYDTNLANKVINTSKDRFRKAKCDTIFTKILKRD